MTENIVKIPTNGIADYIWEKFPLRFTCDAAHESDTEFSNKVYDWCEEQWGPSAIQYPVDEDGDPALGPASDHLDRKWCGLWGDFFFRDDELATAFKVFWG